MPPTISTSGPNTPWWAGKEPAEVIATLRERVHHVKDASGNRYVEALAEVVDDLIVWGASTAGAPSKPALQELDD